MKIGPDDILQNGTKVQIGEKIGTVLSHAIEPSSNGFGPIVVHTFKLTHKIDTTTFKRREIPLKKEIVQRANYSSVYVF